MDPFTITVGAVIVRLWHRRPRRILTCVLWTIVLLVPFAGLPVCLFLREPPKAHGDELPDHSTNAGSSDASHHG